MYEFASGQKYEGHWEKGKKAGWSIYTVETGETACVLHSCVFCGRSWLRQLLPLTSSSAQPPGAGQQARDCRHTNVVGQQA